MPPVFAYVRRIIDEPEGIQESAIRSLCDKHRLQVSDWFRDERSTWETSWLDRPGGQQLANRLELGCQVVAVSRAVYTGIADLARAVQHFADRKVVLHLPDCGLSTEGPAGEVMFAVLRGFAEFQAEVRAVAKRVRSEATREGLAFRRALSYRYTRYPGYGFKWVGRWGQRHRRKPDEAEQAVIRQIVAMREGEGLSWYAIAARLLHQGIRTAAGREWSPDRVRRAFLVAKNGNRVMPN